MLRHIVKEIKWLKRSKKLFAGGVNFIFLRVETLFCKDPKLRLQIEVIKDETRETN
jgi:hypothetical protein